MNGRPLTISDLLADSGYTRDQMRGLLDAIPAYAVRDSKARVAKQYTTQDLLVVRACAQLESRYGLQRVAVGAFSDRLRSILWGPRPVSTASHLLLTFDPPDVHYTEALERLQEGLLVPLAPIFQTVDEYLLPNHLQGSWSQRELGFGPRAVISATSEAASQTLAAHESVKTPRRKL